jgi:hypothetical protein
MIVGQFFYHILKKSESEDWAEFRYDLHYVQPLLVRMREGDKWSKPGEQAGEEVMGVDWGKLGTVACTKRIAPEMVALCGASRVTRTSEALLFSRSKHSSVKIANSNKPTDMSQLQMHEGDHNKIHGF